MMTFRMVETDDLYKLVEIACTTFIETYGDKNDPEEFYPYVEKTFSPETLIEELHTEGSLFYFLEQQNEPIGYFKLNVNKSPLQTDRPSFHFDFSPFSSMQMSELERIYLRKAFHGKGIAAKLMQYIEDCARQNQSLYLWLGVWTLNPRAVRYYQKCGFNVFGEHIFQIGSDAQKDFLMWKKL